MILPVPFLLQFCSTALKLTENLLAETPTHEPPEPAFNNTSPKPSPDLEVRTPSPTASSESRNLSSLTNLEPEFQLCQDLNRTV